MGPLSRCLICACLLAAAARPADLAALGYPVEALAADREGNLYLAGTTRSPGLAVKNAFQPEMAESHFLRSDDRGATWERAGTIPLDPPTALAADPFLPGLLYAGGIDGIHKSADGGRTWRLVLPLKQVSYPGVVEIVPDPVAPGRVFAVAWSHGLVRSDDAGETWTALDPGPYITSLDRLRVDPHGSGALLTTTAFNLRLSRDGGRTWEALPPPPGVPGGGRVAAFDPHRRGWIWLGTAAGTLGQFYLSTDFGKTWEARTNPPSGAIYYDLMGDPERPDVLYAVTLGGFARSEDGGRSWKSPGGFRTIGKLAAMPRGCGAPGTLVSAGPAQRSTDGGDTWTPLDIDGSTLAASGAGCRFWIGRGLAGEAFVAKVTPGGDTAWATYLGGGGADAARRIAVDAQGSVTVAGVTGSRDFPGEVHGTRGSEEMFVTRFDRHGRLVYSTLLAGPSTDVPLSLAVDPEGAALVAGRMAGDGAVARLDAGGRPVWLERLGLLPYPRFPGDAGSTLAVAPAGGGGAWVAGPDGRLRRLDAAGGVAEDRLLCEGCAASALAAGPDGSLYVAGTSSAPDFTVTAGTFRTGVRSTYCSLQRRYTVEPGDLFVMKFAPGEAAPSVRALIGADCRTIPDSMLVDEEGRIAISAATLAAAFPLRRPLAGSPTGAFAGVALELSPGAGDLLFATYSGQTGAPPVARGPGRLLYMGTDRVDLTPLPEPRLDRVLHALRGTVVVAPGGLVMLEGAGLGPEEPQDRGLNAHERLPEELDGVSVRFDGQAAPMLFAGPERLVAVAPAGLTDQTVVEVRRGGAVSNAVRMRVAQDAGLLTAEYPARPPYDSSAPPPPGWVQNEDGSSNGPDNPARAGSRIRVFLTGLRVPYDAPEPEPGTISWAETPAGQVWGSWQFVGRTPPSPVRLLEGFVSALRQAEFEVPARPAQAPPGPLAFQVYSYDPTYATRPMPDSNPIGIWIE